VYATRGISQQKWYIKVVKDRGVLSCFSTERLLMFQRPEKFHLIDIEVLDIQGFRFEESTLTIEVSGVWVYEGFPSLSNVIQGGNCTFIIQGIVLSVRLIYHYKDETEKEFSGVNYTIKDFNNMNSSETIPGLLKLYDLSIYGVDKALNAYVTWLIVGEDIEIVPKP
jgi:hypothetical protein